MTLTSGSAYEVLNGSAVDLMNAVVNQGTFSLESSGSATVLFADGDVDLTGGGVIEMSDHVGNRIQGRDAADRLTNQDNTIRGAGNVGANFMSLTNHGLIEANQSEALTVDPGAGGMINTGTMRATGSGGLKLNTGTYVNTIGTIEALDGSRVQITGATIQGGSIETSGTGQVELIGHTTLEGVTLDGIVEQSDGVRTTLVGSVVNQGTWTMNAAGNWTDWLTDGDVALSGGGTIVLSAAAPWNRIRGEFDDRLTNLDNHIRGAGRIGDGVITLTNNGTIEADDGTYDLMVNLRSPGIHNGEFRATNGGTLQIYSDFSGTGRWTADGGTIELMSNADVLTGGPISIINGGALTLTNASISGSDLTLDGSGAINVASTVSLSGDLAFAMIDEALWAWAASADLEMTGGVGATAGVWGDWASLEVGGWDYGTDPSGHVGDPLGFTNNFELPELVIGAGAQVFLADLLDNGNRGGPFGGSEALYVDTLTFADGAGRLNLNGLNLYYGTLNGDLNQIFNEVVPEPATLGLLAVGGIAVLKRQRATTERTK